MAIKVFAVTGTNGKTTVSCMLRNILKTKGNECGLIGTIAHQIGEDIYPSVNTTPGDGLLKEYFHQMKEKGIEYCVMEVSSHGIDQGRVDHIEIDYAGFTNLSQDHLDYHKTMEIYYQAKKKLFFLCHKGAIINLDDSYGRRLYRELKEESEDIIIKGYSLLDKTADYYGQIKDENMRGTRIKVEPWGEFYIPIPGRHFAQNGLLAASMALEDSLDSSHIKTALENLPTVPGRMEFIGKEEDTLAIVDYAHTPDGLENLLRTVRKYKKGRLICIFGCGGFRDKEKRKIMGRIAGKYSDYTIITNDNPRGEPAENIASAIEEGIYETGGDYLVVLDRYQAIKRGVFLSRKWDIIIVAGKGHETYQLIGDKKRPFNDRQVLKELLEKKYETTYD
ncbi:MAG: UDP-N-acetylmuramoyl-L-alanyl-D-glutamate--2,6-diaminopimelate ligase [Anaerovoracaceae bacterium]